MPSEYSPFKLTGTGRLASLTNTPIKPPGAIEDTPEIKPRMLNFEPKTQNENNNEENFESILGMYASMPPNFHAHEHLDKHQASTVSPLKLALLEDDNRTEQQGQGPQTTQEVLLTVQQVD